MANFDSTTTARRESVKNAASLQDQVRHAYNVAKQVQEKLLLYQSQADPTFNAAVNALYTASERAELGQMLSDINAFVTSWETNHPAAIAN